MYAARPLTLSEFKQALERVGEDFVLLGNVADAQFAPASTAAPVENGIYFMSHASIDLARLQNSICFVSMAQVPGNNLLVLTAQPQLTYYKFLEATYGPNKKSGIHPTAIVSKDAQIHESAYVGPYCVVDAAIIGAEVQLHSHVAVMDGSRIGAKTVIEPHTVIGATGVVWCWDSADDRRVSPPQLGFTDIGENCFLGSGITVVRGAISEATSIGDNTVIAHGTRIGHGTKIGKESHLANGVLIGGNVEIGDRSFLGSGCVLRPNVKLAAKTTVGCGAVVIDNFAEPDLTLVGVPAHVSKAKTKQRKAGVPDMRRM